MSEVKYQLFPIDPDDEGDPCDADAFDELEALEAEQLELELDPSNTGHRSLRVPCVVISLESSESLL